MFVVGWRTKTAMKHLISIIAILGIVAIEYMALKAGINGKMLALSLCAIAGLGGYEVGIHKHK